MSTYASLHYHITFSTKERMKWISTEWENRLHGYLGGCVRGLGGFPQGIGGIEDHIHLLVGLKTTHRICDFMRELKKSATEWIHTEIGMRDFAWQVGYGIFTVSATACPSVKRYIAHQREHHRKKTYKEELIELLGKAGVEYDPQYLQ